MNIQGVHRATDSFIRNSFSPLVPLTDTVLFPLEESDLSRSCTEQTAPSTRSKRGRGSNPVLHSINKTQKQVLFPPIANQIPENIYTCRINQNQELLMDVGIASKSHEFQIIPALLDSRANATFIDKAVADRLGLTLEALTNPIRVFNVDGSHNSAGDVTHAVNITVDFLGHREELRTEVTNLGKNSLILGYTWLKKHNPLIDWEKGMVKFHRCPRSCLMLQDRAQHLASLDKEDEREALEWIHQAKVEAPAKKPVQSPEELVPPCYHSYLNIFSEKAASRFPLRKPWDHAIDLNDSFTPKKGRLIPLSVDEQKEVSEFVDEQLAKGYIRPSKSEQTSPVFFVPKKDGRKRMVQDYRYLNEHTVRNNYPLPLISQLVDKLKGSQYFTKIDLQWGYNNVWIKEGDEWKAAFVCHRGSYEPTVMFFGLCNSPATFQTMMNEIFADMEDVVVVYIDDIMIFTKGTLAEHQAKVKEVLQRLRDNDLFARPEKCSFDKRSEERRVGKEC